MACTCNAGPFDCGHHPSCPLHEPNRAERRPTELERAAAACYLIVARERATLEHFRKTGATFAEQSRIAEGIKRAEECAAAIMALK